ncbi:Eco57I restriction-modification methylase domain-containing protein [Halorubrum ezzemoulense]|uniref:site-specific DNA-methyltransferase (adenine-specific) n=2 Tax=Halorubrum ezzemoulense TaxID=337243 RepID=A0A256JXD0_HALEZ|nr:TaqI-like C-terminal specificity domain-containing protein [Halorubrum ezzemoulense]OYR73485.1 restriction endonuclease [Halorubrum ezzemoulense]
MSQATLGSGPYRNSNLFSGYYLDERVGDLDAWDCDEEAEKAFEQIRDLWNKEGALLPSYNEDELIDTWIAEVVDILGHGTSSEVTLPDGGGYVDRLLFEDDDMRREGAKRARDGDHEGLFSRASAILEAKQWDADFEARFAEQRSYRDASHQIKYYLERTPSDLKWGVLTDGKKWRLYGTKDYETQTYYEVDLPEILESGDLESFKYFFAFFRPEAFVETAGSSFLDDVWTESETAAQELGEDLQDNVFRALRVLGKGFVESNDLDVHEDGDVDRDELKEQSLVLLYRLMFVLYAESRGLIDPDDPDASEEYHEYFSLESKREEILDDVEDMDVESGEAFTEGYSRFSSSIWGRLSELFELIDEGEDSLDIPPYNGGLFSREDHVFLDNYEVKDPYIAEVIYWLSTTENDEGEHVPADYADLDTRHLGSIYEGLLEHEFRIADAEGVAAVSEDSGQVWKPASEVTAAEAVEIVEEGGLYVVNDEGERKATGAYYTPDYVVTYIVEETVDPLINEIDEDLREQGLEPSDREYFADFWQEVKGLTILDPAMGSGHFLTKATGYLTEQVMEVVREQEIQSYDEQYIRREISKECIYGVDLNGMAVELSKLSMWLETLAADQPLAFLDHHLKTGNSLVGSDITEVLSEDGDDDDSGQLTLTQAFAHVRQDTLEHVMELMADLLAYDNETLDDVKSMEELYDEIRADPLYTRLFELANVHTAEESGCDVPEDAYEQMAGAIEEGDDWAEIREEDWFTAAQATADEQDFFHWELEFPEVFFDSEGEKKDEAGFDTVMGNPPYIRVQNLRQDNPSLVEYLENSIRYSTSTGRYDIYSPFVERGSALASSNSLGYILPNKFFESGGGKPLRSHLVDTESIRRIVDFSENQIFTGVTTYTCILLLEEGNDEFEYSSIEELPDSAGDIRQGNKASMDIGNLSADPWVLTDPQTESILNQIETVGQTMSGVSQQILQGMKSGDNDVLFVELIERGEDDTIRSPANGERYTIESDLVEPIILGKNIHRYEPPQTDLGVIYPYESTEDGTEIIPENELQNKYPKTYSYFVDFEDRLRGRQSEHMRYETWYALNRPRKKSFFENPKIIVPDICERSEFTIDNSGEYFIGNTGYGIVPKKNSKSMRQYLLAVLNSSTTWFYIYHTSTVLENDFRRFLASYLGPLPVPDVDPLSDHESEAGDRTQKLAGLGEDQTRRYREKSTLNLSLLDHLGNHSVNQSLGETGFIQPPRDSSQSLLQETTEQKPNLRTGSVSLVRESENTVLVRASARYKPDDEDAYETDQWGYTETEYLPAFRITDLTEQEADLIEHFVPVAVNEAGGFANFRETATKTNSLIDRLKAIELPDVDDVADNLENYLETKERAEELDAKIEQTDQLIDEIVYELYGLTEEEIEIVEEAVGE